MGNSSGTSISGNQILKLYDPNTETVVAADASSFVLAAVITQVQENGVRRPVAYASRAMKPIDQRYAKVEREALALTWACEQFSDFIIGKHCRLGQITYL